RSLVIFLGATGCRICTPDETWNISGFPAAMLNATAAGDAFVAGVVYGVARRWPWPEVGRFANAVGTLSTRDLRAQGTLGTLPSLDEVEMFLERHPSDSVH
ncbi:MAG: carbohydrate kinase family protein, partial [Chloroflexota bacterium]|nr:carbohydrate kinase family protein [Chloroflexota bacterium]